MSNKLNILESKKLFREFNYLMSDVEFKNEFSREYGREFEKELKSMLNEEPIFKQACKDKFGNILDKPADAPNVNQSSTPGDVLNLELSDSTELVVFTGQTISSEPVIKLESDNQKLKDLYRKIVQKTHPDKVNSDALSEFYVRATEANKRGDILTIYAVSNELGIKFDISDEEITILRRQIHMIKLEQDNFEKSHFWVWANTKFDGKKKDIIKHFLFHNAPAVKNLFWT
jgi:hypothetical protein